MENFITSPLGFFHFFVSLIAMVAGTLVLFKKKGSEQHKRIGYLYVVTMLLVCGSSFGMYRLTGRFGVFHWLALVGLATLAAGMIPMWMKKWSRQAKGVHLWFMYYSVLGLYAAFASELSVRIPNKPFYTMVGLTTAIIFIVGSVFIFKKEKVWSKHFS